MVNTNDAKDTERTQVLEGKGERTAWWPFYALLGASGGLLSWEAWNPLPAIPGEIIGFIAFGLLFTGIALWVIFSFKKLQ